MTGQVLPRDLGSRHGDALRELAIGDASSRLAVMLYPWLRSDADAHGRGDASPERIRYQVIPWVDCGTEDVKLALRALSDQGLIVLYDAYYAFPDWDAEQPATRGRGRSAFPDPPVDIAPSDPQRADVPHCTPVRSTVQRRALLRTTVQRRTGVRGPAPSPSPSLPVPLSPLSPDPRSYRELSSSPGPVSSPPTPPGGDDDEAAMHVRAVLERLIPGARPHSGALRRLADLGAERVSSALTPAIEAHRRSRGDEPIVSWRWALAAVDRALSATPARASPIAVTPVLGPMGLALSYRVKEVQP